MGAKYRFVRGSLTLLLLPLAWAVWGLGLAGAVALMPVGIALSNWAAARGLGRMSRGLPRSISLALRGLGLGVVLLALADTVLGYRLWTGGEALRGLNDALYVAGALTVAAAGAALPWAVEGLGLHPKGHALRQTLIAFGSGVLLTLGVAALQTPLAPILYVFLAISIGLAVLFLLEAQAMHNIRLSQGIRAIVWALALVAVGRIVGSFGGAEPSQLTLALYGLFWLAAMSLLAWVGHLQRFQARRATSG
ncbi:MAG: hypothetical protein SFU83_20170 [Meiothermus sp.]|nr:hypothetical protein [Meiothermus sp.]